MNGAIADGRSSGPGTICTVTVPARSLHAQRRIQRTHVHLSTTCSRAPATDTGSVSASVTRSTSAFGTDHFHLGGVTVILPTR